jgi:hypothetical protein
MLARQRAKLVRARPDLGLVSSQDRDRFLLGARNFRLLVFNYSRGVGVNNETMKSGEWTDGSRVRRVLASFQLDGRREPLCLTRM